MAGGNRSWACGQGVGSDTPVSIANRRSHASGLPRETTFASGLAARHADLAPASRNTLDSRRIQTGDLADSTVSDRVRGNVWSFRHSEPRLRAPRQSRFTDDVVCPASVRAFGRFAGRLISSIRLLRLLQGDVADATTQGAFGRSCGGDPSKSATCSSTLRRVVMVR